MKPTTRSETARAGRPRMTRRAVKKQETRERILQAAATIARREGLPAASIPRVMREAGLTIGGFYNHFSSKAAMDAEVIRTVLGVVPGRAFSGLQNLTGMAWIHRAVIRYLSTAHRDNPDGCAFPAILSAIATGPAEVKAAYTEALERRVQAFQANMPAMAGVSARERALAAMALTVGGLLIARASAGSEISDEMLEACRKWALPELDATAS
jgi:TetR/AcrR family transcriptional regulator, transcriptional repressor for nem operon